MCCEEAQLTADSDREIPAKMGVTGKEKSRIDPMASLYMGDEGGDGVLVTHGEEEESTDRSRAGKRSFLRCISFELSCTVASSSASVVMKHRMPGRVWFRATTSISPSLTLRR